MEISSDPRFVHLHLHTEYSLIDGLVRIKPLVKAVTASAMPAIAVTDHTNLFCLVRFYKAALAAGIKPIAGTELAVVNPTDPAKPYRLVLLVQDLVGYKNLTRLISRAYMEGQHQGRAQVQRDWVLEAADGLIALSGGAGGDVGRALVGGHRADAEALLDDWLRVFGDRYYLELMRTGRDNDADCVEASVDLAIAKGVPVVATNDVAFLHAEDFDAHEVRVCIHNSHTLDDPRRPHDHTPEQFLRTPAEMALLFSDIPEALENSVEIAKRCNLELTLGKSFLPASPIPAGMTIDEFFGAESRKGLDWRLERILDRAAPDYAPRRKLYEERLRIELDVICQMGFPGYFLIVADFIQWAKDNGIPVGPGRGSGAGSLVAYALKITDLDPLEHELLFERFLNPERVSMPDFDVDFCMEGRDRVIDYVAEKYGRDAVSQIITFGTMAAKAVVRDVGRVLGHPYGFVDRVAKMVPFELGMTLDRALEESPELKAAYAEDEAVTAIIDMARKLEGVARNAGKHAGGVVIAPTKLTDFAPLYCEPGGANLVTQYDKDDVEQAGLVKFDFLGLRTLTIIDWALNTINAQRKADGEPPIDISRIDPKDPEAFGLLQRCETTAVFQLESRGMKELIKKLQPDSFEDMTALVALFRPGPLQSGMVDDFIDRKHGRADVAYPHPDLEPILKPTYGVILYQEQVMQIAQVLAGYSLGGADLLRRAMGKKKQSEMDKQRAIFEKGAGERGVEAKTATYIFDLMDKFAGYGFNKCVVGETLVADADTGELRQVKEIYRNGISSVASLHDSKQMGTGAVVAVMQNGIKPVLKLTTSLGKTIRATGNHPLLTPSGWKALAELKPGDRIAAPSVLPVEGTESWPEHELITLGWTLLEGNTTEKHFPAAVFRLNNADLALLLGRLWSEDGYVAGTDRNNMTPYLASASHRLVRECQHLLLRLGMISRLTEKRFSYKEGRIGYTLHLLGRRSIERFVETIGPRLIGRAVQLEALKEYLGTTSAELIQETQAELFWERIVAIEPDGAAMTYDLEVAETHNFVANDIVVHNSHSAAYALVSYQTLWLKTHYPAAFMAAVLSADMDNTDKVVTLIDECRSMQLRVEPPKINRSEFRFTSQGDDVVIYGLGAIKGVGESAISAMLEARDSGGPFKDIWDFCRRIDLQKANKRVFEALIRAGALDDLGGDDLGDDGPLSRGAETPARAGGRHRATLMNQLPLALKLAEQQHEQEAAGQADLFGVLDDGPSGVLEPDPQIAARRWPDWDEEERLLGEKETLGLYLTGHPINRYDAELNAMVSQRIGKLLESAQGTVTPGVTHLRGKDDRDLRTVVGLVVGMRSNKTARGRMASLTLDDRTGRIEATVFNDVYEPTRELLVPDAILAVTGSLKPDDFTNGWTLIARGIRTLEAARAELADHLLLHLDLSAPARHAAGSEHLSRLRDALEPFRADDGLPLRIHYRRPGVEGRLRFGDAWRVEPADALLKRLRHLLGDDGIEVVYQRERVRRPSPTEAASPPRLAVVR